MSAIIEEYRKLRDRFKVLQPTVPHIEEGFDRRIKSIMAFQGFQTEAEAIHHLLYNDRNLEPLRLQPIDVSQLPSLKASL